MHVYDAVGVKVRGVFAKFGSLVALCGVLMFTATAGLSNPPLPTGKKFDFYMPTENASGRCEPGFVRDPVSSKCTCPSNQQPMLSLSSGSAMFGRCGNVSCLSATVTAEGDPMLINYAAYGTGVNFLIGNQNDPAAIPIVTEEQGQEFYSAFVAYQDESAIDLFEGNGSLKGVCDNVTGRIFRFDPVTGAVLNNINDKPFTVNQYLPPTTEISSCQNDPELTYTKAPHHLVLVAYMDGSSVAPQSGNDVVVQAFTKFGTQITQSPVVVNQTKSGNQSAPDILALDNSAVIVSWRGDGSGDNNANFYAVIEDPTDIAGTLSGESFLTATGNDPATAGRPHLVKLPNNRFAAAFNDTILGNNDIYLRIFDASTPSSVTAVTDNVEVNTFKAGTQWAVRAASLPDGTIMVIWQNEGDAVDANGERRDPDASKGVYGRVFNVDGTARSPEIKVSTYVAGDQFTNNIIALDNSYFLATWMSSIETDGSTGSGVYGQIFNRDGVQVGKEFAFNVGGAKAGVQDQVAVVNSVPGQFVAMWRSDSYPTGTVNRFGSSAIDDQGPSVIGQRFKYQVSTKCE